MQQSTRARRFMALCFFLFIYELGAGQNPVWPVNLQKEYKKSYPVGRNMVALLNKFGKMEIATWDKNEVQLEARISVGAQNSEFAQKVLDRIAIEDENTDGRIQFRTSLKEEQNNWPDNNGGHEMRIDWVVHLPASTVLYAENRFGPLTIGDYSGVVELQCRYGTLTAGKLTNRKLIDVQFGRAEIASMSDTTRLVFKYSGINVNQLSGVMKADFQFCNSIDLPVDNSLKQLDIKSNYTSLYLLTSKDFSADYDITTNNARATGKNDIHLQETVTGATTSSSSVRTVSNAVNIASFSPNHRYSGSIGKGGGTKIEIRSSFGNVRIM